MSRFNVVAFTQLQIHAVPKLRGVLRGMHGAHLYKCFSRSKMKTLCIHQVVYRVPKEKEKAWGSAAVMYNFVFIWVGSCFYNTHSMELAAKAVEMC